jgi:hypothetical protein
MRSDHASAGVRCWIERGSAQVEAASERAVESRAPWHLLVAQRFADRRQREVAAVLYCGPDSVITGSAALMRHGVRCPRTETVDVLIRHAIKRAVAQLVAELQAGQAQGSAALRAALEEVADGVASAAEGDLRKLIKIGKLPEPMYNPSLYVGSDFLAQPDVWWPDAGVAAELDSREWHLSPELWKRTMARHSAMSAQGIIVLHFTPSRIRSDASRVIAELRSAIEAGSRRPALAIRTIPHR